MVDTYATQGTYTFTVPLGVTLITVECVGGGGAGASINTVGAGGGGGGGAFATSNISVIPGATYSIIVGSGGSLSDGGDSSFGTIVLAKGGKGVATNVTTGGLGGTTAASIGTTKYAGGAGRNGSLGNFGGGGGGGAGSTGAGTTATTGAGGAGNSPGGAGGAGGISGNQHGGYPVVPVGGGGGGAIVISTGSYIGGRGRSGIVILTYTPDKGFTRFYLLS